MFARWYLGINLILSRDGKMFQHQVGFWQPQKTRLYSGSHKRKMRKYFTTKQYTGTGEFVFTTLIMFVLVLLLLL